MLCFLGDPVCLVLKYCKVPLLLYFVLCLLFQFGLMEIENRGDEAAIQDALLAKTGGRTVPRVFIGGKFVGGGSEVKELQDSNQLVPLLQAAGAL